MSELTIKKSEYSYSVPINDFTDIKTCEFSDVNETLRVLLKLDTDTFKVLQTLLNGDILNVERLDPGYTNMIVETYNDWDSNWRVRYIESIVRWRESLDTYSKLKHQPVNISSYMSSISDLEILVGTDMSN